MFLPEGQCANGQVLLDYWFLQNRGAPSLSDSLLPQERIERLLYKTALTIMNQLLKVYYTASLSLHLLRLTESSLQLANFTSKTMKISSQIN